MVCQRIRRKIGVPYLRTVKHSQKHSLSKKWFIRFKENIEYSYSRYIVKQSGIDVTDKIVLYKDEYDWVNPPTLNDLYLISKSEYFKRNYIHNLSPEIKEAIHAIIELSKIINYELGNNTKRSKKRSNGNNTTVKK